MTDFEFEADIRNCVKILRNGGVILYPTDTIWGLGCDATNQSAVEKIFRIKERHESKSLIILVNSNMMLERYIREIPTAASQIIEVSDKPLTIIYPGCKNVAPAVIAEDGSAGIRITEDEFCSELITRFRKPVVSTSANKSGSPTPAIFSEITGEIISSADYVVKFRQHDLEKRQASPVIKVELNGIIKIIRK
jgi:L-threonylcarbamoyladenylate synthase